MYEIWIDYIYNTEWELAFYAETNKEYCQLLEDLFENEKDEIRGLFVYSNKENTIVESY